MRLYLDDVRPTPPGFDLRALTAPEAIAMLTAHPVTFISFDHDLGAPACGTGYDVACAIEERVHADPTYIPPAYAIHSGNPVGRENIEQAMQGAARAVARRTP